LEHILLQRCVIEVSPKTRTRVSAHPARAKGTLDRQWEISYSNSNSCISLTGTGCFNLRGNRAELLEVNEKTRSEHQENDVSPVIRAHYSITE
jgi:hypothetical protein